MNSPRQRLNRKSLDPDSLSFSQENLDMIRQIIPRVLEQLQSDKESVVASGGHDQMKMIAHATEQYLGDLQGWCSRAEDILEQQAEEQMRYKSGSKHGHSKGRAGDGRAHLGGGVGGILDGGDEEDDFDDDDEDDEDDDMDDDDDCQMLLADGYQYNSGGNGASSSTFLSGSSSAAAVAGNSGGQYVEFVEKPLALTRAERGRFMVNLGNRTQECEGLVDYDTGNFFVFERVIRDTIYGNVIRAQSAQSAGGRQVALTGGGFAIKVFQKDLVRNKRARGGQPVQEDPIKELKIQQHLSNPGTPTVLKLVGCFEDNNYLYAVLPLAGMELFDLISTHGPFDEKRSRIVFRDMIDALAYIHHHGISHRDVSPENYLLDLQNQRPILIDFGLAYTMKRRRPSANNETNDLGKRPSYWELIPHSGFVGKLLYAAPEMWSTRPYDGTAVDLWSAAVTLFVMLFQAPPWERARVSRKRDGYASIVLQNNLRAVLRAWQFQASEHLIDLLQCIFREDPNERPTLEAVIAHPWMQQHEN